MKPTYRYLSIHSQDAYTFSSLLSEVSSMFYVLCIVKEIPIPRVKKCKKEIEEETKNISYMRKYRWM